MGVATITGHGTQLPGGMRASSIGERAGACILDALVVSMLGIIPLIVAFATGAVSLNQQALDQWQAGPPRADDAAYDMLGIANFVSHKLHNLYSLEMWGAGRIRVGAGLPATAGLPLTMVSAR